MDHTAVVAKIYEHLEDDHAERAVMACLRLARGLKDHVNSAVFLRELYPNRQEVARALHSDMSDLKEEARKYVWDVSLERWLDVHTLENLMPEDASKEPGEQRNVLSVSVGELEGELEQWERAIDDLRLPQGMDPFDAAAFTDSYVNRKAEIRHRIKAVQTLKARIKARCLNYAVQIERQLDQQHQTQGFLEAVQNDVNNYFKERCEDVFLKLRKAGQLVSSTDPEDAALLLTEVRRALKAAADHFYPARTDPVTCSDGKQRVLGDEQYLNRLEEFVAGRFARSRAHDLLKDELTSLATFMRRLNDMASKGVHSRVSFGEAKQGLIGLYFFLFNLQQRLDHVETDVA